MGTGNSPARILLLLALSVYAGKAMAEPCILAYPAGPVSFLYDTARYEAKTAGDPLFDPAYSVGGLMLWDKLKERIAFEVYQAPGLDAFGPSLSGRNEFLFFGLELPLVIDGFAETPRQLSDVIVQFSPQPVSASVTILVDDVPVRDLRHAVPRIVVSTPTGTGHYSDTVTINIRYSGVLRVDIIVYQDRNGNRIFDGDECYTTIIEDFTIPVEEKTWGSIKALYQGN